MINTLGLTVASRVSMFHMGMGGRRSTKGNSMGDRRGDRKGSVSRVVFKLQVHFLRPFAFFRS